MFFDRGNHYEFLSLGQELAAPGDLQHPQTFDFNFKNVEKQYESYNGINVKLRYFVRVTVSRRMPDVVREKDIWVYSYRIPPETNSSIKMDVGIEDCLHIEFEYSKSKYHLKDVIVGRIYFLLVRLKIKHMELSIIRRETTGVAPNQYNESETLVRFEVCPLNQDVFRALLTASRSWMAHHQEVLQLETRITIHCDTDPSSTHRRNNTHPPLPRRLRPNPYLPRSQQEILNTLLPKSSPHRRRYALPHPTILTTKLTPPSTDARRYFKQSEIVLYRQAPEIAAAQLQQAQSQPQQITGAASGIPQKSE